MRSVRSSSAHRATGKSRGKYLSVLLCSLMFMGCASPRVQECKSIAGSGWAWMGVPPSDAAQLLSLQGVPENNSIIWLGKGPNHVLACSYQAGLINPGCSSSQAYEFVRDSQGWKSKGILLSACDIDQ